jgi:hypothetical protein
MPSIRCKRKNSEITKEIREEKFASRRLEAQMSALSSARRFRLRRKADYLAYVPSTW